VPLRSPRSVSDPILGAVRQSCRCLRWLPAKWKCDTFVKHGNLSLMRLRCAGKWTFLLFLRRTLQCRAPLRRPRDYGLCLAAEAWYHTEAAIGLKFPSLQFFHHASE
jgi:hypothetical protein